MENVTLQVKGMSCNHCVKAVEGSVGCFGWRTRGKSEFSSGRSKCTFDQSKVTIDQIKETIDEQGYDVE